MSVTTKKENDVVLDPFNGVGTTTYVAQMLDRRFIGIDISEEYCKIAKDRMDSEIITTSQTL